MFIRESGDSATFSTAELSQEIDSNAIDYYTFLAEKLVSNKIEIIPPIMKLSQE